MARAYFAPSESVLLDQSSGRISASIVRVYPPGIPVLWPGRRINTDIINDLQLAQKSGQTIIGVDMDGHQKIAVLLNGDHYEN